uniref:Uncharacterized protein n=1 Tax=Arundo donax TaxID=35708 RepID=A0A0A9AWX3_ARUDO
MVRKNNSSKRWQESTRLQICVTILKTGVSGGCFTISP